MRQLVLAAVAFSGLFSASQVMAAPVDGYEGLYSANYAACTLPDGTVAACEAAIQSHVTALVSGGIDLDTANVSFQALRAEVFEANEPDEDFQLAIDNLFELLLPDSGAIGVIDTDTPASLVTGTGGDAPIPGSLS
jgi:hypothetical protein